MAYNCPKCGKEGYHQGPDGKYVCDGLLENETVEKYEPSVSSRAISGVNERAALRGEKH